VGRLVAQLAVATQIPPSVWLEQDDDIIWTVIDILERRADG
jgi:hypothetical protein